MATLAFYKVDEGSGVTLVDSSGNGNDATLSGPLLNFWDDEQVAQSIQDAENAADALYFMDASNHAVPKTQVEFLSDGVVNFDKQRFFKVCVGERGELTVYKVKLVGEDLFKALKHNCLAEAVTVDGEVVTVNGETVYVRL